MNIRSIYQQYQVPPNLERHMREVAVVSSCLLEHWHGEPVNAEATLVSALVHDLGNIVKFKRPFLGELADRAPHWQRVQDKFVLKYGMDAKLATRKILKEIGLDAAVGPILHDMDQILKGKVAVLPEAMLVEMGDLCVSPEGIVGYEARKQDLLDRYGEHYGESWIQAADRLYVTVEERTKCQIEGITEHDFSNQFEKIDTFLDHYLISL